jgi:glycosyltransferase involved in cell wall biosynthesis
MRQPRVAVVTSGFPRRSETFAVNELTALADRGFLAGIFATKPGDHGDMQPDCVPLLPFVEVLPGSDPREQGDFLARRLARRGVTGLHAYFAHAPADVAEHTARRLAVPFGFSVHAKDARKVPAAALAARAIRAACVIACNHDVAGELRTVGAASYLIPHGVDRNRFRPSAPRGHGTLTLLAVGRLVEKKGFHVLIDALAAADDAWRLRIVGDGPERARLVARVDAAGLTARVTFVGTCTHRELPHEYAHADAVVVPSIVDRTGDRDGLPNVVLEAMACGRPVVGTRVGAIAAAVTDGETGLLIDPGSASALGDALRRLARDPEARRAMGERASAAVAHDYDLSHCTGRFSDVIEAAYA